MGTVLSRIFSNLTSYISKYKVLYEEELRQAIGSEIAKLDGSDRPELERQIGAEPAEVIFQSIVGAPMSIFSPSLARREYLGETFYAPHVHRSFMDEVKQAFKRLVKTRVPMILPPMEAAIISFLKKAGYTSFNIADLDEPIESKEIEAGKGDESLRLLLLPSIAFASQCPDWAQVIVVPTENTPALFIRFFKDQHSEETNIQVWVVNLEEATVSPFFGNCGDEDILKNFDNPDLREMVARHFQSPL